jgi:DoxX-like family
MPIQENTTYRYWIKTFLTIAIALVWLINGFFCKVLNLVPRHQLIISRILGEYNAGIVTKIIGLSEILLFAWIISEKRSRLCAVTQIIIIATMNVIEFFLAPDLLLFGRLNIILATALIIIIYLNEFVINKDVPKISNGN